MKNPLQSYLARRGISRAEFTRMISGHVGWPVARSQVTRWASGETTPGRLWRQAIAQATNGEVPADVW